MSIERYQWVDHAKGIGILAIVCTHVLRGLDTAGIGTIHGSAFFDSFFYAFQVPLFFFLSGLFLGNSMATRSWVAFARQKTATLFYPYAVWQIVHTGVMLMVGSAALNHPADWRMIVLTPIQPQWHFWFIYTLWLTALLVASSGPLARMPVILLAVSVCVYPLPFLNLPVVREWPPISYVLMHLPYVCLGMVTTTRIHRLRMSLVVWFFITIVCFGGVSILTALGVGYRTPYRLVAAVFGIFGTVGLAKVLVDRSAFGWAGILGSYSLEIYILHVIFAAGCRIVLNRLLNIESFGILALMCIGAGIAGPLIIGAICRKMHLPAFRWATT